MDTPVRDLTDHSHKLDAKRDGRRVQPARRDAVPRAALRDVAERAGVSIATVSRVLNGRPDVAAATRAAVLRHVRELGYVSNRVARASWETGLIGLSVPQIRGDYVTEIVTGAVEALYERDARLIICSARQEPEPGVALQDRLMNGITDGALLILPSESNAELTALRRSGYPFVVIDPITPVDDDVPVVAAANWSGAKLAAEHLIGLGHTHIGIITGPAGTCSSNDRMAGYQAALFAAGIPFVPKLVCESDLTMSGGAEAARRLLEQPHAPSAIFACNDSMAIGALQAARERGLAVPHDLSIVGFDDVEMASITTPPLTTVQQPLQGLGRLGVEVLHRLLHGQELDAARIELSARLVVRGSTAPPRGISFLTY